MRGETLSSIIKMIISELAKIKIEELLQNNKANFLKVALIGNQALGHHITITLENKKDTQFIIINSSPEIVTDFKSYPKLVNATFDFFQNEIQITF